MEPETGSGIAGTDYEIHFKDGTKLTGTLDDQGKALHENIERKQVTKVVYKPRKPESDKPAAPLEDFSNG